MRRQSGSCNKIVISRRHFNGKSRIFLGAVCLITVICWLFTEPITHISFVMQFSQLLAALSLVGFAYVNFISTRHSSVEHLFDGVDKAYAPHKWVSIGSLLLVTLHIGLFAVDNALSTAETAADASIWGVIGTSSFLLFLALVLIAILAKKMK